MNKEKEQLEILSELLGMPQPKAIEPSFGVILLLDALGARDYTIEDSKTYLDNRNKLLSDMNLYTKIILEYFAKEKKAWVDIELGPPELITFGDSIMLVWRLNKDMPDKEMALYFVGVWSTILISFGMKRNLLFRGAVSMGDFIFSNNGPNDSTLLGPAVSDAANWYEKAQCFGLVATPSTSFKLQHLYYNEDQLWPAFIPYDIPIKEGHVNLYAAAWPWGFIYDWSKPKDNLSKDPRRDFISAMKECSIPAGAESKYTNSVKFFDACIKYLQDNYPEKIKG